MAILVAPDDPTEYMAAMAAIMIAGTTVASGSVFIEQGLDAATAQFPAVILTCPSTRNDRLTITPGYQGTFDIRVLYFDRWESSTRTFEQAIADAKTALYLMARNVRAAPSLGLTNAAGLPNICQADLHQRVLVDGKKRDLGLGFPMVVGTFESTVIGPYYQPS